MNYRPVRHDARVLTFIPIIQDGTWWHHAAIHNEFIKRYPDDPKSRTRGAAIRNDLQRYCPTRPQYIEGNAPFFEYNSSEGKWRFLPDHGLYLPSDFRLDMLVDIPTIARSEISPSLVPDLAELSPLLANIRELNRNELGGLNNKQTTLKEGFVYIMTNPAWQNAIKIGSALDYIARLNQFQTGDPNRAYLLNFVAHSIDRKRAETIAHDTLSQYRINGEWFQYTCEMAKPIVQKVCADLR